MSSEPIGLVVSVNVGQPREVRWHGRTVNTAIWKQPVRGRIPAADVNLDGDDQADRRVHGGPTKAIYAYAAEDYQWWADALGSPLEPGTFGENLTVAGRRAELIESGAAPSAWEPSFRRACLSQHRRLGRLRERATQAAIEGEWRWHRVASMGQGGRSPVDPVLRP